MGTKTHNNYEDLITFTRASAGHALRPVSYGSERVTNGTFDTDSDWTKGTGWSIGSGVATKTAGTGSNLQATSFTGEVGKIYQVKYDLTLTAGAVNLTVLGVITPNASSSGSYTHNIVATTSSGLRVFANNTAAGTIDNISVKEVTFDESDGTLTLFEHPNNVPRVEWDADRNRLGLLVEVARTNLIANSDFDAGVSQSGVTITANASESPDGLENATSLDLTASGGFAYFTVSVTAGTEYTWSWFAKAGTATTWVKAVYDTTNAAFVSREEYTLTSGQNYGNGWYRHTETFTAPTGCTQVRVYAIRGTTNSGSPAGVQGTTFVWGGQLEADAFASSIIRTTGSTATRSSDVATLSFDNFGHNKKEMTLFCDFDYRNWQNSPTYHRAVSLGRSTTSTNANFGVFNNGATSGTLRYRVDNSSGTPVLSAGDLSGSNAVTSAKVALAVKEGQHAITYNGNTPVTSTGGDPELEYVDILAIGARWAEAPQSAADYGQCHIKSIKYYPRRLTNAQLQEITS